MLDGLKGYTPYYVTRPEPDGTVTIHRVGTSWLWLTTFVLQGNILGWGLYGLYALGDKII